MKKIVLFLGVALLSLSMNAAPVASVQKAAKSNIIQSAVVQAPNTEFQAVKSLKVAAPKAKQATTDTIMIYGVSQKAYYSSDIIFIAKLGKSAVFDYSIFNEEGYYIAAGAFYGNAVDTLATQGNYGLFSFPTDAILNYGMNYKDIEEQGADPEIVASWKKQWMEHVTAVEQDEETGEYYYALKPGKYVAMVEGYDRSYRTVTEAHDYAPFMVEWLSASNFKADIALDNTTATISWDVPEVYNDSVFQMQVVVYDSERNAIYNNYDQEGDTLKPVSSPLTINVTEGTTYTVSSQILTSNRHPAGLQEEFVFTVGTSDYAPTNLNAQVLEEIGDSVVFTWTSVTPPTVFNVEVYYKSGDYLAELGYKEGDLVVSSGWIKAYGIGTILPPGTYTWAVIAGLYDGQYISYASEYVKGPEFTTVDLAAPQITAYSVESAEGSTSATITFEVEDNYYDVDDMTFYVSGDLTGTWITKNGAYTVENLEVGREYTINVSVEDPAGNINDLAFTTITFTAGAGSQGVDQVIFDIKANKVLHNGHLIIKRDNKAFNVLGAQL